MVEEIRRVTALMRQLPAEDRRMVLEFVESLAQERAVVDAQFARRKVSAWLVSQVGHLLMGGTPRYIRGERPFWRVPVLVTRGYRGEAGFVDVDAITGELIVGEHTPGEILARVKTLVGDTASH